MLALLTYLSATTRLSVASSMFMGQYSQIGFISVKGFQSSLYLHSLHL